MVTKRKRTDASGRRAQTGGRQDAAAYSRAEAADRVRSVRQAKDARRRRWPLVVVGVLVGVLVLVAGVFSWDRWWRYDDAAELQGEWQVHGAPSTVVIDGAAIHITADVAYAYAIDPGAKTISYAFGSADGSGRYRFSLDRSQLVIMDGDGYSWWSTLFDDVAWMAGQALDAVQGREPEAPAAEDGVTVLDRKSHQAAGEPGGTGDGGA